MVKKEDPRDPYLEGLLARKEKLQQIDAEGGIGGDKANIPALPEDVETNELTQFGSEKTGPLPVRRFGLTVRGMSDSDILQQFLSGVKRESGDGGTTLNSSDGPTKR